MRAVAAPVSSSAFAARVAEVDALLDALSYLLVFECCVPHVDARVQDAHFDPLAGLPPVGLKDFLVDSVNVGEPNVHAWGKG